LEVIQIRLGGALCFGIVILISIILLPIHLFLNICLIIFILITLVSVFPSIIVTPYSLSRQSVLQYYLFIKRVFSTNSTTDGWIALTSSGTAALAVFLFQFLFVF